MSALNYVDLLLLLPLLYGFVRGLLRGLVRELGALLALVAGAVVAYRYAPGLQAELAARFNASDMGLYILAFAMVFILVALMIYWISRLLTTLLRLLALGLINRLLGALFGCAKILVIMLVLLHLSHPWTQHWREEQPQWRNSTVYQEMMKLSLPREWTESLPEAEEIFNRGE